MNRFRRLFATLALTFGIAHSGLAQKTTIVVGDPRFDAFTGGPDIIDLGSLNVHWDIPMVHQKGRGIDFDYKLSFDSLFTPYPDGYTWRFVAGGGKGGFLTNSTLVTYECGGGGGVCVQWGAFVYVDEGGTAHPFNNNTWVYKVQNAPQTSNGFPALALDNSGIKLICPTCVTGGAYQPVVQLPSGLIVANQQQAVGDGTNYDPSQSFQDNNGNYIYWSGNYSEVPTTGTQNYIDTLGNPVLSTYVTLPQGNYQQWQGTGTVVKSYAGGSYTVVFNNHQATSVTMPDGRSYSFTYGTQVLPGTGTSNLTSVTLPGGGSVAYSANADGSYGFTRTVNDGKGHASKWKYSQTLDQGFPTSTTVTDPLGNQTVYGLSAFEQAFPQIQSGPEYTSSDTYDNYTESYWWYYKNVYSGLASAGNVLESSQKGFPAYGGLKGNTLDFWETDTTVFGPNNTTKTSAVSTEYNGTGQTIETDFYDYGPVGGLKGKLLGATITDYAIVGQILDHPASVSQYDGQGVLLSQTTYGYDQGGVAATSNTPNHTTPSASRGNLTSIIKSTSGNATVGYGLSYYDTGLVYQSWGASTPTVSYTYGQCGNAYPTTVSETVSVSLTASTSWNCSTGVPLSQTDVNGNTTTLNYDAYARPSSTVDAAGNTTTMTYPTATSNTSSVTQAFAGNAPSQYSQTSYDGLGRAILSQTRQGPTGSTYTSVSQVYDLDGRTTWTSIPYSAAAGSYLTTVPGTTTTIDAAGRLSKSTDSGGGTVTYSYNFYDVSITAGPAATGENAKTRTLEYDGAGRLTAVCEITSMTGSGSCGQSTTGSGFLTAYTYQGGQVSQIAQNSQAGSTKSQMRTINYDLLGRTTLQQMPETGTKTFVYDSDASGVCPGSYPGSLVKTTDNAGNVQCMTYDAAGRVLSTQTVAGIYSSLTPQTHYVYDAASLNGTAMQNVKGTVAEEYTCTGACTTKLTDIFNSSYYEVSGGQKTGRTISQTWESTPHSSNYFTSQSISYANGAPAAIGASLNGTSIGFPSITYGLDTFGRPWTVSDSTHSLTLVSGTGYNNLTNSVTGITFGNTDSEAYGYDPATNRPTTVNYSVKSSTPLSIASSLTWNPNASLKNFTLSDSSDSTKNQNCNYAMDDLNRLASVSCQGSWAQSFSYDPFGNIAKGPISNPGTGQFSQTYAAGYSNLTNQANSGVTAVYDRNGNQTQAEANTLTFNAAGQAIVVNNIVGTYDAAGRVVETGGSIAAVPATVSTGAISLSGAEQVVPAYNTYQGASTATVTITGSEKSQTFTPPLPSNCAYRSGNTCYDAGGGEFAVNVIALSTGQSVAGISFGIGYSQPTDTATSIAAATAAGINSMTSTTGVSATSSGGVVTLIMTAEYTSQVGFQVSGGMGCIGLFSPCSFAATVSPLGMITGNYVSTTPAVYDSGTVTAAISNFPVATYAYGSSDTQATVAAGLAASINSKDSSSVSATATTVNGVPTVQVSSKATGYGINWPIAISTSYNTSSFTKPSFGQYTTTNVANGYPAVAGVTGSGAYTQFVYSPSGAKIAVVQNGSLVKGTVPLPGGASAIYSSAGLKYLRHQDWLGSSRLATTWAHFVYSKTAYAPFGESYNQAGTTDLSFTGEDQDTSGGVYDFQFRKYDPIAGRWMSPDPSGLYYADPANPQSINLYGYALNNAMILTDADGLCPDCAIDPCTTSVNNYSSDCGSYSNYIDPMADVNAYESASTNEWIRDFYHDYLTRYFDIDDPGLSSQSPDPASCSEQLTSTVSTFLAGQNVPGPWSGLARTIVTDGLGEQVDPRLMSSILALESGNGQHFSGNNPFGLGPGNTYPSPEKAITAEAYNLNKFIYRWGETTVARLYNGQGGVATGRWHETWAPAPAYCTSGAKCIKGGETVAAFMTSQGGNPLALNKPPCP